MLITASPTPPPSKASHLPLPTRSIPFLSVIRKGSRLLRDNNKTKQHDKTKANTLEQEKANRRKEFKRSHKKQRVTGVHTPKSHNNTKVEAII